MGEGMKPFISSGKECARAGVLSLLYHSEMLSVPHLSPHPCFPFFGCLFLVLFASRPMGYLLTTEEGFSRLAVLGLSRYRLPHESETVS